MRTAGFNSGVMGSAGLELGVGSGAGEVPLVPAGAAAGV